MPNNNNLRILVVEDEADLQDILAELLPYYNLSVDVASSAEQALDLLAHNSYAGAMIDIGLPGMDGCALVKMIHNQSATQELPCVAMSAWHSSAMKRNALEAGFNTYFAKPFVPETIVHDLKAAIGLI